MLSAEIMEAIRSEKEGRKRDSEESYRKLPNIGGIIRVLRMIETDDNLIRDFVRCSMLEEKDNGMI